MNVLGINAFHGDASAALVVDGELVIAVDEERFRRIKHCAGFPRLAIEACLEHAGLAPEEIDRFAISRAPKAHSWRKLAFALTHRPSFTMVADRWRNRTRVDSAASRIASELGLPEQMVASRLRQVEHHPAHLASAFFVSPFDEAAVCAIDGFGDFVSTSTAIGRQGSMDVDRRIFFPHSLGLLYQAITQFLGFPNYGDEYKVMGLAPYGDDRYVDRLRRLVHLEADGRFRLELEYFRHWREGVEMSWEDGAPSVGRVYARRLESLLGKPRAEDEAVTRDHESIAHSLQIVYEECAFHVLRDLRQRSAMNRLCLAGGCAMNSVANGKIRRETGFEEVFVQPAGGDNGTALGAALYAHMAEGDARRFAMTHGYWGTAYSNEAVRAALEANEDLATRAQLFPPTGANELCEWTAEQLDRGRIVGWFQGRMEWGARALGNRSILADPRRHDIRSTINAKIKFRERFRPFAPSVLAEARDRYFEGAVDDPFMVQVYPIRADKRGEIPAVTHVDGTGRLQTVDRASNPLYWELIRAFERRSGVPVLLNTSFNENEPIVQSPSEALDCFLRTDMDVLVIEGYRLIKKSLSQRDAPSARSQLVHELTN